MIRSARAVLREALACRQARRLGTALLAVDGALVLANLVLGLLKLNDASVDYYGPWNLSMDGSYGELFDYLKTALLVLFLIVARLRSRQPAYSAWAATFLLVVLDDALQLHEQAETALVELLRLHGWLGLRPADVASLVIAGGIAAVVVPSLVTAHGRSDTLARRHSLLLAACLVLLGLFAVGFDLVHAELDQRAAGSAIVSLAGLVEDGGEMVALSLACAAGSFAARPRMEVQR